MKQLADGVWQLSGFPPNAINVFVIEDVLIDASTRYATRRILRQVDGHPLTAHALTHAHPDHQGASHNVCERLEIPFWVGEADADAAEQPTLIGERQPDHFMAQLFFRTCTGPGHPVDRKLSEGDRVGEFEVLHVPGHSIGHVAFWRESDRVLIAGDVFNSADPFTAIPGLREPKAFFTPDPAENRRSAKRLGLLEPKLVLLGHGPPYRDTKKFVEFCAALPD
jgi:glyoxylase-like metal-dependent hydrolase (beta-lactamase superfamily II)